MVHTFNPNTKEAEAGGSQPARATQRNLEKSSGKNFLKLLFWDMENNTKFKRADSYARDPVTERSKLHRSLGITEVCSL